MELLNVDMGPVEQQRCRLAERVQGHGVDAPRMGFVIDKKVGCLRGFDKIDRISNIVSHVNSFRQHYVVRRVR